MMSSPHTVVSLQESRPLQQSLEEALVEIEESAPPLYTWGAFVRWLEQPPGATAPELCAVMEKIAARLKEAARGADIYLADNRAYVADVLNWEFPELTIFRIDPARAFTRSATDARFSMETQHFANLRSLSGMRRELRRTKSADGLKAIDVLLAILGYDSAHQLNVARGHSIRA
jgi:hypothetical protein